MNRLDFYNVVTNDELQELDHLNTNLSKFVMHYPIRYYRVEEVDLYRPDMISYKCYGTVNYWWLLMMINGIGDIFTGLSIGMILKVPDIMDIYAFYKKYRV